MCWANTEKVWTLFVSVRVWACKFFFFFFFLPAPCRWPLLRLFFVCMFRVSFLSLFKVSAQGRAYSRSSHVERPRARAFVYRNLHTSTPHTKWQKLLVCVNEGLVFFLFFSFYVCMRSSCGSQHLTMQWITALARPFIAAYFDVIAGGALVENRKKKNCQPSLLVPQSYSLFPFSSARECPNLFRCSTWALLA